MNLGPDGSLKKITPSVKPTNNIAIIAVHDELKSKVPFYKLICVGAEENEESDESESSEDNFETNSMKPFMVARKNNSDIVKKPTSDDRKDNKSLHTTRNSKHSHKTEKHTNNRPTGNRNVSNNSSRGFQNQFPRHPDGRRSFNKDRHPRNTNLSVRDINPWQHIPDSLLINSVPNPINLIENSQIVPLSISPILPPIMKSSVDNSKKGLLGNSPFDQLQQNFSHINLNPIERQYRGNQQIRKDLFLNDQKYYEKPISNEYWQENDYADNYQELLPDRPLDHSDFQNPGPSHRSFNPNRNFTRPIACNGRSNYQRYDMDGPPMNMSSNYERTDVNEPIEHYNNFQGSGIDRDFDPYSCPNPDRDGPPNHSNDQRPQGYLSHRQRIGGQLNTYIKPDPDANIATNTRFNYHRLGGGTYNFKQYRSPRKGFFTRNYRNKYAWKTKGKKKINRDEDKEQTVKETGPGHFSYDY